MALEIRLLGTPTALRDRSSLPPPRGTKPWGLMAYVLLNPMASSRSRLVSMLFSEAEDPLAALRWNLNALRRFLGEPESFRGDPIEPGLSEGSWVDVDILRSGSWPEAIELDGLGRELLEGLRFDASPSFDAWLTAERRRVAAEAESVLREACLVRLAAAEFTEAAEVSGRLLAMNPLDEGAHELLVRSLTAGGREDAARAHLDQATRMIRDELGVEPGPELLGAAEPPTNARRPAHPISVKAAMEAGRALLYAGQLKGVRILRDAVDDARATAEPELLLETLLTYGTALSFTDSLESERDAAQLHEALALAERLGSHRWAAQAHWQVAFGEYWRGNYTRARTRLQKAIQRALGHRVATARIAYLEACILTETARYSESIEAFQGALSALDEGTEPYDLAFAMAMLGRAELLAGSLESSERTLDHALVVTRSRWAAFFPWVEALRGDVELKRGNFDYASELFEHGYELACHQYKSNRCQSLNARGLGLVSAAKGDLDAAVRWLDVARARVTRSSHLYVWFRVYALNALCEVATANHLPGARTWVSELEHLAGRHGMQELLARAYVLRDRIGDEGALTAARSLASNIDSASLQALITS